MTYELRNSDITDAGSLTSNNGKPIIPSNCYVDADHLSTQRSLAASADSVSNLLSICSSVKSGKRTKQPCVSLTIQVLLF
jgi:hypothetical protein